MTTRRPTWAGRIPGGLDPAAWSFLHSLPHDTFLAPDDVRGTLAHVSGLEAAGVLSSTEARRLRAALGNLEIPFHDDADEDVHSALERVLTERLGDLGAKVHAGRSRNDQVATALRLYARRTVLELIDAVLGLQEALVSRADEHRATLAPGYTHLQRAQPVTIGHWLLAHAWAFRRDVARLWAAFAAADVSPLGAGALAGTTLGIDPSVAASELGFSGVFGNSLDAVSDRDFLLDAAYAAAVASTHLSRLGEELVVWSSTEFGFLVLPEAFATGSSMMPQKMNPDVGELARGQTGPAVGALVGLLSTLKGLPLAYDRDLQADKQNLRGALESVALAFRAVAGLVSAVGFDEARLLAAASDDALLATDVAEALVARGVPFRAAHERVAALAGSGELRGAITADPNAVAPLSAAEAVALLDPRAAVARRTTPGGPAPRSVARQIRTLAAAGRRDRARLADARAKGGAATRGSRRRQT